MSEINTCIHLGLRKNTSASTCNTKYTVGFLLEGLSSQASYFKSFLLYWSSILIRSGNVLFSPMQHLTSQSSYMSHTFALVFSRPNEWALLFLSFETTNMIPTILSVTNGARVSSKNTSKWSKGGKWNTPELSELQETSHSVVTKHVGVNDQKLKSSICQMKSKGKTG